MANATVTLGGVIGLVLAVPLVGSLIPAADANKASESPLTPDEYKQLQSATDKPIKVTFEKRTKDGYLPEQDDEQFVWAVKTTEAQMKAARPQLFEGDEKLSYPVVTMGFTIFSPICPHLGCRFNWSDDLKKFACPCHGSQFTNLGEHTAGPALRGLDPLPLADSDGKAAITWITYKNNTPDHIVLSYS
jgi:menaquinol-cytochrome c reductase iron-sulfur subunit